MTEEEKLAKRLNETIDGIVEGWNLLGVVAMWLLGAALCGGVLLIVAIIIAGQYH